jgi:hypothetical protein
MSGSEKLIPVEVVTHEAQKNVLENMPGISLAPMRFGINHNAYATIPFSVGAAALVSSYITAAHTQAETVLPPLDASITMLGLGTAASLFMAHQRNKRGLQTAISQHEALRTEWEQPIDRYGTVMRWYGFDYGYHATGFDPEDNLPEFRRLVSIAPTKDVTKIAVSNTAIKSLLPEDHTLDPTVVKGINYLHHQVEDNLSDEDIAVLNVEQAQYLIAELIDQRQNKRLDPAIKLLETIDPFHPVLQAYREGGIADHSRLQRILHPRLESASHDGYRAREWDDNRTGWKHSRVHTRRMLSGDQFQLISSSVDNRGTERLRMEGRQVLSAHSANALVDSARLAVANGNKPVEDLELALWLNIEDYKKHALVRRSSPAVNGSLQTRVLAHRPRLIDRINKSERDPGTFVHDRNPALNPRQMLTLAGGAIALLAVLTPTGAGSGSGHGNPYSVSKAGSIGDISSHDIHHPGTVWHMERHNGASSAGYWAQNVSNQLILTETAHPGSALLPPYDIGMEFGTNYGRYPKAVTGLTLPTDVSTNHPYIVVSNNLNPKNQQTYQYASHVRPSLEETEELPFSVGYELPVLQGDTITSVDVTVDGHKAAPGDFEVFTQPDGTYSLRAKKAAPYPSLAVRYTVEESSTSPRIRAASLVQVLYPTGSEPITKAMTDADAIRALQALPGHSADTDTSFGHVVQAIHDSHHYSYTPYKDAAKSRALLGTEDSNGLVGIAKVAAKLTGTNCNTASMQAFVMTRGVGDDGQAVDPVGGFRNNNDNALRSDEAHMWLTDSYGDYGDPSPLGQPDSKGESTSKMPGLAIGGGAAGLMLLAGAAKALSWRRRKNATATLKSTDTTTVRALHEQASLLEYALYAPADTAITPERAKALGAKKADQPLTNRYKALPTTSPSRLKRILSNRDLPLDGEVKQDLIDFVRQLHLARR